MHTVQGVKLAAVAAALCTVAAFTAGCGSSSSGSQAGAGTSSGSATQSGAASLGKKDPATGSTITLGLINGEDGPAAAEPQTGDAAVAAADYANEYLGGLDGHKIKVERCADTGDGTSGIACANKFVAQKLPAVIIGEPVTADQYYPIIERAGIPYVGSDPSSDIGDADAFFFTGGFIAEMAAQAVYSHSKAWKSMTMFGAQTQELISGVNALGKPFFQKEGLKFSLVPVPLGTADATSQVTAGTQGNPQVIDLEGDTTVCQSVLSALQTVGSTAPKFINATCLLNSVIDSVGKSAINGSVYVSEADTSTSNPEGKLYQSVMAAYAPKDDPGGVAVTGYLSMLGFIRAVNSVGIKGTVTAATVTAALKAAKNVPLPAGNGKTFSCNKTQFPSPAIKATICSPWMFVTTYNQATPGPYVPVDSAGVFK